MQTETQVHENAYQALKMENGKSAARALSKDWPLPASFLQILTILILR